MTGNAYAWVDFYSQLADELRAYRTRRTELYAIAKNAYAGAGMGLPKLETDGETVEMDPFTFFALFNRGLTTANRIAIAQKLHDAFALKAPVPHAFAGVPLANNQKTTFYWFKPGRGEHDIDNLWHLFEAALDFADSPNDETRTRFADAFDQVRPQIGIKWNITMGLFWIRPEHYLTLDGRSRWFLCQPECMPKDFINQAKLLFDRNETPHGTDYMHLIDLCRAVLNTGSYEYTTFPELSDKAMSQSEAVNQQNKQRKSQELSGNDTVRRRYWAYRPGPRGELWDECVKDGMMRLGWGDLGNFRSIASRKDIQAQLQHDYPSDTTQTNNSKAIWEFSHIMKPGDVVFAYQGLKPSEILGRGVVKEGYRYDPDREDDHRNARMVDWKNLGIISIDSQVSPRKTLTDISDKIELIRQLDELYADEDTDDTPIVAQESYSRTQFLDDVYMNGQQYDDICAVLQRKRNIILTGAPGVGKTYAAKRLAWSIIGEKDEDRIAMVQFHQSYSYEDFIMGYRPTKTGYELHEGLFYSFCKKAESDPDNAYYFIIDEINRGNLSRIFGELFMLVEADKRGDRYAMPLMYGNEMFSVPPNLYLIGLMNTADRSLAMIDYALRRRFAFIELQPGFDIPGFQKYAASLGNDQFTALVTCVKSLNDTISKDPSLGPGFRIGHSFLCGLTAETATLDTLEGIIRYELAPLIREYWFDETEKAGKWIEQLEESLR
ncbi:AAA family ATPase [Bifidobacterium platyrrhinorum]|uniref:AAA domain-containing protein n=1 Tax=Bifidobacterium platyrrhinorum TaxID=2661628 RepID=A0A6L9SQL1_9BIFI|nr:AAA family ATPase [Bifidobacterium platyrrhinorum]NEG54279.1 AAA domain-containing protein [Bifidobacterium platyrrhinorum]